ncbi:MULTISPECIES: cupin domain-containing protein [Chelativorans]|nr:MULTISPECIES: cupin domain-containing protein [Chelativorans]
MSEDAMADEVIVSRNDRHLVVPTSWGRLVWQVGASQNNSRNLTVGMCYIEPGQANGRHYHPNCEEVLTVVSGRIVHTWDDQEVEMSEGDAITIPANIVHNARNIGEHTAAMFIVFSSAYRAAIAEEKQ